MKYKIKGICTVADVATENNWVITTKAMHEAITKVINPVTIVTENIEAPLPLGHATVRICQSNPSHLEYEGEIETDEPLSKEDYAVGAVWTGEVDAEQKQVDGFQERTLQIKNTSAELQSLMLHNRLMIPNPLIKITELTEVVVPEEVAKEAIEPKTNPTMPVSEVATKEDAEKKAEEILYRVAPGGSAVVPEESEEPVSPEEPNPPAPEGDVEDTPSGVDDSDKPAWQKEKSE